jgi:hypothetical protein
MRNITLERMDFDSFIWIEFMEFMMEDGNHIAFKEGVILRPDLEFHAFNIPSRNPIVGNELWRAILLSHLKQLYN